jgi:protocatechuate 3,4-dioxygenase alpha subunit
MTRAGQTPSQTVGPFFAYGLVPQQYGYELSSVFGAALARPDTPGLAIRLSGQIFDGNNDPIGDALIEIRQADSQGAYPASPAEVQATGFTGFGRCGTGTLPGKAYEFRTVKPGATADGQAPHIDVIVSMRGLLSHVFTRIYFSDEAPANARDPVLQSVAPQRRKTLIAQRIDEAGGVTYRFDIRMQGDLETVFFDV